MKLGTQTASLINHLHSRGTIGQPTPVVGMGATTLGWTDRRAATIVKVTEFGGSKQWAFEIEVVLDDAKVISGSCHDGSAVFEYSPRPDGYRDLYRFSKKTQKWVNGYISKETGEFRTGSDGGLLIGQRDHYIDPSF